MVQPLSPTLIARDAPLSPVGFVVVGDAVARAVARLRSDDDVGRFAVVRGAADGADLLVVLALSDGVDVPWVDGARFIGREPRAPTLLVPTTLVADVPAMWLAAAIAKRHSGPVLVLEDRLVPLGSARRVDAAVLAWLEAP